MRFMYLITLFIVFQSSPSEFDIYQLTNSIAFAISSLVHIVANIKFPTADAYSTRDISIFSTLLLGYIHEYDLKLTGRKQKLAYRIAY